MADFKRLTVVYEHPHWFKPLFRELERRGIPFRDVDVSTATFDPSRLTADHDVVFNRISPSAWTRGRGHLIAQTRSWLAGLERRGVDTINGTHAFEIEISKALQLQFLAAVNARAPRARAVRDLDGLVSASETLEFPLVVKPNIGGSGAGIKLFRNVEELSSGVEQGEIEQPLGTILLLQEYHQPAGRSIVRVETLDGKYLYAIRIHLSEDADDFDLCPADLCKTTGGADLTSAACPVGAEKQGLTVEAYTPPSGVIDTVERIARETQLDVGGIEYLQSDRDGEIHYYDVNALSNFVADPLTVIGFDPVSRLVDSIETRISRGSASLAAPEVQIAGGAR